MDLRENRLVELGQMVNVLVHDVRNPIGVIKGFASLLHKDLGEQPNQQKMTGNILKATEQLEGLINSVLEYSRPLNLNLAKTNLKELIQNYANQDPTIQLKATSSPELDIDALRFKMALEEIVKNAKEAEASQVEIHLKELDGKTVIEVQDNGSGLSESSCEKVFEPFFSTKPQHAGFGLSEARKVIREHGGDLLFHSTEGKGTKITIILG